VSPGSKRTQHRWVQGAWRRWDRKQGATGVEDESALEQGATRVEVEALGQEAGSHWG
jgi:hypothetical protein